MNRQVFVPGIGQFENIGDIILRRPLIDWLRENGPLHVYVGKSPKAYDRGLGLKPEDIVYHSFIRWYVSAVWNALKLNAHYVFKPGEIQLSIPGLKEHLVVLPLLLIVRLTGGRVVRVGSGARNFASLPRLFMKPSIWLSNLVMWRDAKTTAYMQSGETMPDLAFATGVSVNEHLSLNDRDVLVVSMRGDRDHLSDIWLSSLRKYAAFHHLKICVITQVLRDSELSQQLALKLDAAVLDWDGENHDLQELKLRELYSHTHTVVSDRLHVLITAFTHGALPVGMLAYGSDKINRHFEAIGVKDISVFTENLSEDEILSAMNKVFDRRVSVFEALTVARKKLLDVKQSITSLLARG